ncbi:hypothetical protein [Salicibibacter kimchii]|uniref:Uncharacterized protein n=1 Tax=Salicibibacter kimchii TaxID=2099786 RepID=A0A345BZ06_9BACI|nr:hypothetical protein [Salicibibacter kimchii]AXF56187.1 hypothetical protein DT065_09270 [Salicibibacter kimchii]
MSIPDKIIQEIDMLSEQERHSGLLKPSVARSSKIISVHGSELKRYIGELHKHDLERVFYMRRNLF